MKLLIDAGNTFIKWVVVDKRTWLSSGNLPLNQVGNLSAKITDNYKIEQIWVSNVAGENLKRKISELNIKGAERPIFIKACDVQCGVRSHYAAVEQLGCDRWAALIAAWDLYAQGCLVVNCGTATTVDTLSDRGEFIGGLILPGINLIQSSLVDNTAQIEMGDAEYMKFPVNTQSAMFSGAIQATCGAIERQYFMMGTTGVPIVLSGGASAIIRPYLNELSVHIMDNLVLRGLMLISEASNS